MVPIETTLQTWHWDKPEAITMNQETTEKGVH
jgi:hypothetical protein